MIFDLLLGTRLREFRANFTLLVFRNLISAAWLICYLDSVGNPGEEIKVFLDAQLIELLLNDLRGFGLKLLLFLFYRYFGDFSGYQ